MLIGRALRVWFGWAALGALAVAAPASGAFLGVEVRENTGLPSAEGLPGFPGAPNVRVFSIFGKFNGSAEDDLRNQVLSVGQPNETDGLGIELLFNPGANFYRAPASSGAPIGGVGGVNLALPGDNRRFWSTFVSIGVQVFDPDAGPIFDDATGPDPDFGFVDRDGAGSPPLQNAEFITGGWFNASPPNSQGARCEAVRSGLRADSCRRHGRGSRFSVR